DAAKYSLLWAQTTIEILLRKYFRLIDEYIENSRDTSFEQMIMRQMYGRGVDIVLNSLAEEKLIASVRCLVQNGRFLEIGKFDMISNNCLSMSLFQKGIRILFHGILLDNMFNSNHKNIKDIKVVNQNTSLAELGMDSMMAVEIKQTLEREFDIFLTAQEIRNLTFAKLKKISSRNDNIENEKIPNIEDKEMIDMENEKLINIDVSDFIKLLIGVVESKYFILEPCVNLPTKGKEITTKVLLVKYCIFILFYINIYLFYYFIIIF
ncbi:hypothetical protein P5V15_011210, partial [Pogonomyrmex californicus]